MSDTTETETELTATARLPLSTDCGACGHTLNWHARSGCAVYGCPCSRFTTDVADNPAAASVQDGAGR